MAITRVTQQFVENIRAHAVVVVHSTRVTQEYVENVKSHAAISVHETRVTQQYVEQVRSHAAIVVAAARITQQYTDVLRGDSAIATPTIHITQQYVDFLRGDNAIASSDFRITHQYAEPIIGYTAVSVPQFRITHQYVEVIRSLASSLVIEIPSTNLTLSTFAPAIAIVPTSPGEEIEIPSGNLTLSTFAPELSQGAGFEIPFGNLSLSTFYPPDLVVAGGFEIPSGNLVLSTSAPLATLNDNLKVIPSANLTLTTSQVLRSRSEIEIPSGDLVLTTSAPDPKLSEIIVPSANLVLSTSLPHSRVLVPYTPTPGSRMRMLILTAASGSILLPPDWNPNANWIWAWGAGGRGAHAYEVGALIASGGGGGSGFHQARNVGGTPGDIWTYQIGQKNLGRDGNATFVQDPILADLARAQSGRNGEFGGFGVGGIGGGGGPSQAGSNRGGWGGRAGGGGGGGGAAGPHSGQGTRGGFGANGGGGFAGIGVGAGGGGGGAVGDFEHPDDGASIARDGQEPAVVGGNTGLVIAVSGSGGPGYYGSGAGAPVGGGSYYDDPEAGPEGLTANPGLENTGGGSSGGAAGIDFVGLTYFTQHGEAGADWTFIQQYPTDVWLFAPFTWSTSLSGRFAELSNGTVPGGGGGGGGAGFGSLLGGGRGRDGGRGGFPGGGGGGAGYDSNGLFGGTVGGDDALGGDGENGLILIFYEGLGGGYCEPCEPDYSPCGETIEPPCVVEWPFALLQPRSVGIFPVPATIGGGPAMFGGHEETKPTSNGFWRFSYGDVPVHDRAQILALHELEVALEGGGIICLHAYDGKRAPWDTIGGEIIARAVGAFASGATSGNISVWTGSALLPGMFWSYGNRLYCLKTVSTPTGSPPVYPVTIFPPVRTEIPNNALLEFARPMCRARLADDSELSLPLDLLEHDSLSLRFEEDH